MQIQISWLLQKPTGLDLHCLQNRVYPGSAGQGLKEMTTKHAKLSSMQRVKYHYFHILISKYNIRLIKAVSEDNFITLKPPSNDDDLVFYVPFNII